MGNNIGDSFFGSYAGDVSPEDAWERIENLDEAYLVDVRTVPEWGFVGIPSIRDLGKEVCFVSWQVYPEMKINDKFEAELQEMIPNKQAEIFFICKVGGRSRQAAIAATKFGYKNCYNIIGGFEGDLDNNNQRGNVSCWKSNNLPWEQS